MNDIVNMQPELYSLIAYQFFFNEYRRISTIGEKVLIYVSQYSQPRTNIWHSDCPVRKTPVEWKVQM